MSYHLSIIWDNGDKYVAEVNETTFREFIEDPGSHYDCLVNLVNPVGFARLSKARTVLAYTQDSV